MTVAEASLIITVLNEAGSIRSFLNSLRHQKVKPSEIVIVDGGSTDGTGDIVREWEPPIGVTVTLLESPGAGISEGRNIAIAAARHDRLLITDAGTEVDDEWGAVLLEAASTHEADVVSGFFRPTGTTLMQRAIAFTITPALREISSESFLPSSRSVSITRQAWTAAGGYPEWLDYCEDLVFDLAMKHAGVKFVFAPSALVTWSARPTLAAFMKQYYRYARGDGKAGLWAKRHAARYSAYLAGVALVGVGFVAPWSWLVLAACSGAYLTKFWGRILRRRREFGSKVAAGLALVPVIVIAGDLAKMVGYPAGLAWRAKYRRSGTKFQLVKG